MGIFDKLKKTREEKAAQKEQAKVEDAAKQKSESKKKTSDKPKKEEAAKPAQIDSVPSRIAHAVLIAPVMTEKSLRLQQENKYVFRVSAQANKISVKQAVKEVYGIPPKSVRIIKEKPQAVNRWGRMIGMTKAGKKAVVTMPEGAVIKLTQ